MSEHALTFKGPSDFVKHLKENDIIYVDFCFTDMRGEMHHTAQHVCTVDEDLLKAGIMFDGSSIAGWKAINESDMILMPDLNKVMTDPFAAQPSVKVFCHVVEPATGAPYSRCPRSIAMAAESYVKKSGLGDTAYFGPEAEFFIFDDVKIHNAMNKVGYEVDSKEGPYNTGREYEGGNLGHRPRVKGGYFPDSPVDSLSDIRAEMLSVMHQMGVPVEKHHHEVAPSQCELGILYSTLTDCGDNMQIYKHVVHNVAEVYGKTATFMPKPIYGDNGSGMHCHQSIWKGGKPLFAGEGYAGLSEMCLHYIGGIIAHARALNALTNATTNSYKRLVPGYEAPVLLAYSSRNRSASCRIPYAPSPKGKRVEVRFPDPASNPYLAFAGMLMAGLDGIRNKIHPGEAIDRNLYELPEEDLRKVPTVCGSLREALGALQADHRFLLEGGVFTEDFLQAYISLKMEEIELYETTPHPVEYLMYYSS